VTASSTHIAALTGMRAYAAVWVMLMHLQFGVGVKPKIVLGTVVAHGYWAVDVFFALSGFLLSLLYARRFETRWRYADYVTYLSARFARIYPLHLAALLVLLVAFTLWTHGHPASQGPGCSLRSFVLNVLLLHAWGLAPTLSWNFPSWSISAEWFAYLSLLPLLARGGARLSWHWVLALTATLWIAAWALIHDRWGPIGEQAITLGALVRITAEFTLGYALHRVLARHRPGAALADALTLGGLAAILLLCFAPARADLFLAPAVAALLAGLGGSGRATRALFANRWAVFWGERSYSIYMVHAVVLGLCGMLVTKLGIADGSAAGPLYLAEALIVLGVSHLAYEHLELPLRERVRDALTSRLLGAAPVAA
jgi:peptidoglycan/LPS O-acetylase OafA/YrhL